MRVAPGDANGFERPAPLWLEIGFGNGELLTHLATTMPGVNFIGSEVYPPGMGRLLRALKHNEIGHVQVVMDDAVTFLHTQVVDGALDRVLLMFPDPWPKKRHHKRRIVNAEFAALLARKLAVGGVFHAATDWEPYKEHMLEVLEACPQLRNMAGASECAQRPDYRTITHFENRGLKLGHGVWDLMYQRIE